MFVIWTQSEEPYSDGTETHMRLTWEHYLLTWTTAEKWLRELPRDTHEAPLWVLAHSQTLRFLVGDEAGGLLFCILF